MKKLLALTAALTLALGLAAGAALTVLGVVLTPLILQWMGTPAEVLPNSIVYFRVYFLGSLSVVMYNVGASILQSVGDSRSPMRYLITASALNVILDLWFIAGLHMGVGGAALATILSQTVSAVLAFRRLSLTREAYGVRWRQVRFHPATLRAVVAQGVPSGVQNSVISVANVIVQANINAFGAQAMAGCGAYSKIEGFAFLPVTCFSMALATFVSQNIGAAKLDRVRKGMRFGLVTSPLLAEAIGLAVFALAPLLIAAFNGEPDVIAFGVRQARTVSLFYCLLSFSHCCAGILRGLGRPTVPMIVMLAVTGPWNEGKSQQKKDERLLRDWQKKLNGKTYLWTYPSKYWVSVRGIPNMAPQAFGDFYRRQSPCIFGAFAEAETDSWIFGYHPKRFLVAASIYLTFAGRFDNMINVDFRCVRSGATE